MPNDIIFFPFLLSMTRRYNKASGNLRLWQDVTKDIVQLWQKFFDSDSLENLTRAD